MPRARNIKPSFFKNEILGEGDPLLGLLFIGLWTLADREGRLEDRPKRIKAEIFPYRESLDVNGYLTELASLGFIHRYTVENTAYIQVVNFLKHQSPHRTEKASEIPGPTENTQTESVGCVVTEQAPLNNGSPPVKESLIPDSLIPDSGFPDRGAKKKRPTRRCPADFIPSEKTLATVQHECPTVDVSRELAKMKDHEFKTPRSDWNAVFRNWARTAEDHGGGKKTRSQSNEDAYREFVGGGYDA